MKAPIPFEKQIQEYERRDRLNKVQRRFVNDVGKVTTKEASDEYRRGYALTFDCPRGRHVYETDNDTGYCPGVCVWCGCDACER